MAIRVRCPNSECKQLLSVPDKLAGKGFRCPKCKHEIRVPAPEPAEEEIIEDVEVVDDTAYSERPQPVRQAVAGPLPDEDFDEDEDYSEDRDRSPVIKSPAEPLNVILFAVGLGLLAAVSFMPLLPWISITQEKEAMNKKATGSITVTGLGSAAISDTDPMSEETSSWTDTLAPQNRPEGLVFLITGVVLTLLGLAGFGLAMTGVLGPRWSWDVATGVTLAGESASIMFVCWQLAWIWKIVTLSEKIRQETRPEILGQMTMTITSTTYPGLGIFIGLGLAVGAAYVFSLLSNRFTSRAWSYLADLGGLLLGGLVLWLLVRAWQAEALFEGVQAL